ncbi:MAG: hypothetical protein LHV68_08080 [Elusimicrobia bacterium]|nr:hypothetical protein [Candidatus Liberimonas magnetica]
METKYFSFQGKKLKLYKVRGDYYAIDIDVAEFFGVDKKYLLFTASKHKAKYLKNDKIVLNKKEVADIFSKREITGKNN